MEDEIRKNPLPYKTYEVPENVLCVRYTKDGRSLLMGTSNTILIAQNTVSVPIASTGRVIGLDTHPDNNECAASASARVRVWDLERQALKSELNRHMHSITSVEYNAYGTCVLTGSRDKMCKIWDARQAQETVTLNGHEAEIINASWNPANEEQIATMARDFTLKVWDMRQAKQPLTRSTRISQHETAMEFSSSGRALIVAGTHLYTYSFPDLVLNARFNLKGESEPTQGSIIGKKALAVVNAITRIPHHDDYIVTTNSDGTVCLCNTHDQEKSFVFKAFKEAAGSTEEHSKMIAVCPDKSSLAVSSYSESVVRLWKLKDLLHESKGSRIHTAKAQASCCALN